VKTSKKCETEKKLYQKPPQKTTTDTVPKTNLLQPTKNTKRNPTNHQTTLISQQETYQPSKTTTNTVPTEKTHKTNHNG
jgi:hypothetical protein